MSDRPPIRLTDARRTKAIGLTIAAMLTLVVVGVFGFAALRAGGRANARNAQPTERMVAAAPAGRPSAAGEIRDIVQSSDEGRIELFDEAGKIAQALTYSRFEPLEGSRFRVAEPRALIFTTDGRMAEVKAQNGQFLQRRATQEPESGWFRGDVRVRLFGRPIDGSPRGADASAAIAAERGPALVEIATDSIEFDLASGEVRTTDPVSLRADVGADAVSFSGQGLTMLLSEKDRRLLFLKLEKGDHFKFLPGEGTRGGVAPEPSPEAAGDVAKTAPEARVDIYRAEFAGPIRVESGESVLDADTMEFWARLVGGSLAPDAILPILADEGDGAAPPTSAPSRDKTAPKGLRDPVSLMWAGALTLRPIPTKPSELAQDDVFVRFSSPKRGLVKFLDASLRAEADASTVDYGMRTRVLALAGLGTRGAVVRVQDSGEAIASRIEVDLGAGVASFPGPGSLAALGKALAQGQTVNDGSRDISWRRRADIGFARATAKGPVALRSASFEGDVRAREGAMLLTTDSLRADFDESAEGRPLVRRIRAEGDAVANAAADGRIAANRLDIAFETTADGRGTRPTVATAIGAVRGEREGATLEAEMVEATFGPDESGRTRVQSFHADLGVQIASGEGADRLEARSDRLRARPMEEVVELTGAASIARGPDTLRAESMRLTGGGARGATVFGAGSVEHLGATGDGVLAVDRLTVEWTDSMTFDDVSGRAECAGGILAVATHGPLERHEAKGARLVIDVTPASPGEAERSVEGSPSPTREVLRVSLLGASEFEEGGAKARFESRRYAEDATAENGLRLEGLAFLDADRVDVDAKAEGLTVPGAGRLLLEDRRTPPPSPENAAPATSSATPTGGGTTLLEWGESMAFTYPTRRGDARGKVRLRHLPHGATEAIELECERLTSLLADGAEELREAEAIGAVYARRGARQLTGDRLQYRYANGSRTAEVTASPGNVVTVFDEGSGQASAAQAISWDIDRDRVKATGSSPIVVPR